MLTTFGPVHNLVAISDNVGGHVSTVGYLGTSGLAERLGVSRHAVAKWRSRYGPNSTHPFPAPDVEIDGVPGWAPERVPEVEFWRAGLPGRGSGGGRPPASRQTYVDAAEIRGLTREEALRLVAGIEEERPELDRREIYAWLTEEFRGA